MPVLFGTAMAVAIGGAEFHPWRFLAALAGMVMLHSGANILSDISDFNKGLDIAVTPVSGAIVRGLINTQEAFVAAASLLFTGSLLGVVLVMLTGWPLLAIGIVGLLIGVCYTVGPALKYRALGDLAVFLDFGILGAVGSWMVQAGSPSWAPAIWSVPMSLLVVGILHANNWRDIAGDSGKSIRTVASMLGDRGSLAYYGFLIFAPYAIVMGMIVATRLFRLGPVMPLTFLATLLALPLSLKLWRRARQRATPTHPFDFVALDGATAQLNLLFGLLCAVAVLLRPLLARWTS